MAGERKREQRRGKEMKRQNKIKRDRPKQVKTIRMKWKNETEQHSDKTKQDKTEQQDNITT